MDDDRPGDVTRLLAAMRNRTPGAADELLPIVYGELRRLAESLLSAERGGHTLQPTALVHEVYLKLVGQQSVGWRDEAQFVGVAAQAMRRVLIDHARKRRAERRGGGTLRRTPLDDLVETLERQSEDLPALDDALTRLAAFDAQKARIVELRFFGGFSVEETARALGVARRAVERDWTLARAWLRGEIHKRGA